MVDKLFKITKLHDFPETECKPANRTPTRLLKITKVRLNKLVFLGGRQSQCPPCSLSSPGAGSPGLIVTKARRLTVFDATVFLVLMKGTG